MSQHISSPQLDARLRRLPFQAPFFAVHQLKRWFPPGTKTVAIRAALNRCGCNELLEHATLPIPKKLPLHYDAEGRIISIEHQLNLLVHQNHDKGSIEQITSSRQRTVGLAEWKLPKREESYKNSRVYFPKDSTFDQFKIPKQNNTWFELKQTEYSPGAIIRGHQFGQSTSSRMPFETMVMAGAPLADVFICLALFEVFLQHYDDDEFASEDEGWWEPTFFSRPVIGVQFAIAKRRNGHPRIVACGRNLSTQYDLMHRVLTIGGFDAGEYVLY